MQVHLLSVEIAIPVAMRGSVGYPCEFAFDLGSGLAFFVPRQGSPLTPGERQVQVTQQAISDFRSLPGGMGRFRFSQLSQPGDFVAAGRVTSLLWLDESEENALLEVQVGELSFSISGSDIGDLTVDYGAWVEFSVKGFTLWEQ